MSILASVVSCFYLASIQSVRERPYLTQAPREEQPLGDFLLIKILRGLLLFAHLLFAAVFTLLLYIIGIPPAFCVGVLAVRVFYAFGGSFISLTL